MNPARLAATKEALAWVLSALTYSTVPTFTSVLAIKADTTTRCQACRGAGQGCVRFLRVFAHPIAIGDDNDDEEEEEDFAQEGSQ